MFADPACDTNGDTPLLAALATAIYKLEQRHLIHMLNLATQIQQLKSYAFTLETRLIEGGIRIERMDAETESDLSSHYDFD